LHLQTNKQTLKILKSEKNIYIEINKNINEVYNIKLSDNEMFG